MPRAVVIYDKYFDSISEAAKESKKAKTTIKLLCELDEYKDCYYTSRILPETKWCNICKQLKALDSFYNCNRKNSFINKTAECKECQKVRSKKYREKNPQVGRAGILKYHHGLTLEDYNKMLVNQKYCCDICGIHEDLLKGNLDVDHDHSNGRIRGLLCGKCNRGLGHYNDNPLLMELAIKYLEKNK